MRMFHRIVATAGTSAFAPPNLPRKWLETNAGKLLRWDRARPVPLSADSVTELPALWNKGVPPVERPMDVSAEYSALHALRSRGRLGPRPTVVLIHSDTDDGRLATELVRPLIERDFDAHVELRKVAISTPRSLPGCVGASEPSCSR